MREDHLAAVEAAARGFSAGLLEGDRTGRKQRSVSGGKASQRRLEEPVAAAAYEAAVAALMTEATDSPDHEELQRLANELTGGLPEGYVDPAEEARDTPHTWT